MGIESFRNAAKNANPNCQKCKGTGSYMYDHNHGTICNLCCKHNMGWWQLSACHGEERDGKWCCRAGCGFIVDEKPEDWPC